jgi:hypothetical protein
MTVMKREDVFRSVLALLAASMSVMPMKMSAQEKESSSPFSTGADLVSSYLWRGTKFGTGPAIQPYVELALGNFAIGGWGNYCFATNEGVEADLYASCSFGFGLSIGATDYYFPGSYTEKIAPDSTIGSDYQGADYFDFSKKSGSHAIEINLGYEIRGFSAAANCVFNEAGGAGSGGGDLYFELGYDFNSFGLFLGGGNGWHTSNGEFALCNIGISANAELQITEKFSLPISGALILNPEKEQFHVVVGVSF